MSLTVGTRLGSFEVISLLGAGGMGEVWRARDTKLHREVALKILPDAFALDAERLARFTREAQVLASLNHPNIAIIHGLEESDDVQALVLELVDGPTLADIIAGQDAPEAESLRSRPAPAALANPEGRARRAGVGPREQLRRGSEGAAGRGSLEPGAPGVGPRRREVGGTPRGLEIDEALPIAHQVAEALEAAHERGIIHRDLKPSNVKVRRRK